MQGEFQCKPSDIYAQAHALQSYTRCGVHGFFNACPCVLEHLHAKSRTNLQISSDLHARCWYIDRNMLAETFVNPCPGIHVQNFYDTKTSALTEMLSHWRSSRVTWKALCIICNVVVSPQKVSTLVSASMLRMGYQTIHVSRMTPLDEGPSH